jgi:hypothetical protein
LAHEFYGRRQLLPVNGPLDCFTAFAAEHSGQAVFGNNRARRQFPDFGENSGSAFDVFLHFKTPPICRTFSVGAQKAPVGIPVPSRLSTSADDEFSTVGTVEANCQRAAGFRIAPTNTVRFCAFPKHLQLHDEHQGFRPHPFGVNAFACVGGEANNQISSSDSFRFQTFKFVVRKRLASAAARWAHANRIISLARGIDPPSLVQRLRATFANLQAPVRFADNRPRFNRAPAPSANGKRFPRRFHSMISPRSSKQSVSPLNQKPNREPTPGPQRVFFA